MAFHFLRQNLDGLELLLLICTLVAEMDTMSKKLYNCTLRRMQIKKFIIVLISIFSLTVFGVFYFFICEIGIGLSYVKMMVEAHGGKVSLLSALEKGTEVTILLPLELK